MKTSSPILASLILLLFTSGVHAAEMFRFDLQSLAYMSTAVIEGDVTDARMVNWVDKLTIKISKVYAGDFKAGDVVVVGLSAYAKIGKDLQATAKFGTGDHLVLFIEPVTQKSWKDDGIPYWPVASGLKLIANGKVTGVEQTSNPGAYENTIDEGNAADYSNKIVDAVKWAAEFHKAIKEKRADTKWLLEQLKSRPPIKIEQWGVRDAIAVALCEAIAAVGDKDAIAQAKAIRTDRYEREILDLPPDSRALPHGRDTAQ